MANRSDSLQPDVHNASDRAAGKGLMEIRVGLNFDEPFYVYFDDYMSESYVTYTIILI